MKLETKRKIAFLMDRILQNVNQPVIDDVVYKVSQKDEEGAIKILLETEGHWLSKEEAELFVIEIKLSLLRTKLKKSVNWILVGVPFIILFLLWINTIGFVGTLLIFAAGAMTTALLHFIINLILR